MMISEQGKNEAILSQQDNFLITVIEIEAIKTMDKITKDLDYKLFIKSKSYI